MLETSQTTPVEKIISRYADGVVRFRWPVLIACLMAVALALYSCVINFGFTTDYRVFFGDDNPQLVAFDKLEATYTKNDNILIVFEPDDGDSFSEHTLRAMEWMTEESWTLPFSTRVDSVTNFQNTSDDQGDLIVAELVDFDDGVSDEEREYAKTVVLNEPVLAGRLVSDGRYTAAGRVAAVQITFTFPKKDIDEVPTAVDAARKKVAQMHEKFPGITTYLSGSTMLNNAFSEAAIVDMSTLTPLMIGVVILVMWLLLRSVTAVLTTMTLVAFSSIIALGVCFAFGVKLTPPTSATPNIIMTLAIADSIHILVSMLVKMRDGENRAQALNHAITINFIPIFLTSATTVLGFLSMNFADAPPLRELGNISAVGVTAAFIFSVTLLPAMISILPMRVTKRRDHMGAGLDWLARTVVAQYKAILVVMSIVVVGLLYAMTFNKADDRFVEYFDSRIAFRTDTEFLQDNIGGLYQIAFDLETGEEYGIAEPEYLRTLERFEAFWRAKSDVVNVDSFVATMKRINKAMNGDRPEEYRIPDTRPLAAANILLYEFGLPAGLDATNQINLNKSGSRFAVTLNNVGSTRTRELEAEGRAWLRENAAHLETQGTSPAVMFSHISKRNIDAMKVGTVIALVGISLLLILALRSLKFGLISLIPNLVPLAMAFGLWAIYSGEIIFTMSVVSGMTLGIIVDDTIHFLSKYLRARRVLGYSTEQAIHYTLTTVGTAITVTSIILIAGFLIIGTSAFSPNSTMTQVSAMAVASALVCDFLLLPALLMVLDRD
jgi:predicted RND superfamily exporter protein